MSIKFGETVSNGIGKFGNLNAVHHIICVHALLLLADPNHQIKNLAKVSHIQHIHQPSFGY